MVFIDDEILAKTGAELFKELLRVYPVAEVEDYYKGSGATGQWKDDIIRLDLQMMYAHTREAGAPYPPKLEDVVLPADMPKAPAAMKPIPLGPKLAAATGKLASTQLGGPRPTVLTTAARPAAGAAPGVAPELRLIALFINKWKLDSGRTNGLLGILTPPQRRFVIQHFKVAPGEADPTGALEVFTAECEATNKWAGAGLKTPLAASGVRPPFAARPQAAAARVNVAVTRPATPSMFQANAAKRPRLMGAQGMAPRPAIAMTRPLINLRGARPLQQTPRMF